VLIGYGVQMRVLFFKRVLRSGSGFSGSWINGAFHKSIHWILVSTGHGLKKWSTGAV
jgi:hypothetical protein